MTINSETITAGKFLGNGTVSVFSYTFKCYAPSNVDAYRRNPDGTDVKLVYLTDYQNTPNANQEAMPGGVVTLASPLAVGAELLLISNAPYTQTFAARNNDNFYAEDVNDGFDRAVIEILQLKAGLDRALKVPIMSDQTPEEYLEVWWQAYYEALAARDQAVAAAESAAISASAAAASAMAAAASQAAAAASEANAAQSEANAAQSAAAAAASQAAAAQSAASAASSASQAAASAAAALASETNARASELAAAASQAAAAAAAAAALASQAAALASEQAAAASQAAALTSELAAESYRDQCIALVAILGSANFKGNWTATETYHAGDAVWYDSAVWVALQDPPVGVPPEPGIYWDTVETVPKNSPAFTGTPTTPTAPEWDNSKQIANTEWAYRAIVYREPSSAGWSSAFTYSDGNITQVDSTYRDGVRKVRQVFGYNTVETDKMETVTDYLAEDGVNYAQRGVYSFVYDAEGNITNVTWSE